MQTSTFSGDSTVAASGTLDASTGTLTAESLEPITSFLSTYDPVSYTCHLDPLYGTFVDEEGHIWCPASKNAESTEGEE